MGEPLRGTEHLAAGRLREFAEANGWSYAREAAPPALSTNLWEQVSYGVVRDRVSGEGWEAGRITGGTRTTEGPSGRGDVTLRVTVSTPENSMPLGYLAITLPRRLPHMILDATANDRRFISSLQKRPRADQALSLEGGFDAHFRLFVPKGYESDALYVFTPDFMALLIDEAGDLDVEVRDDRLFVYRPGGFDLLDPATWMRFERIRTTIGSKAWSQTGMYRDGNSPAPELQFSGPAENVVAAQGRRLRNRLPSPLIGLIAIGLAVPVLVLVIFGVVGSVLLRQFL